MVVKDLLNLLFKYPVKGLVVAGERNGDYTGIIRKEKIVEFGSSNTNLGLELEDNLGNLMVDFTSDNLKSAFDVLDVRVTVPVIDRKGNFLGPESPSSFLKWLVQQEERRKAQEAAKAARIAEEMAVKQAASAKAAAATQMVRQQEPAADDVNYATFNQLLVPVMVRRSDFSRIIRSRSPW